MKKNYNIAIVGLGQVGIYLYNELKIKKKDIETKTGKQIKIVAISAKSKNRTLLHNSLNRVLENHKIIGNKVRLSIDVDPL